MINKKAGLLLLGTAAVCVAGCVPTKVSDARLPRWANLLEDAQRATESIRAALHLKKPAQETANAQSAPTTPPVLDKPTDRQAQDALKQAYAAAAANERLKSLGIDPTNIVEAIAAYRADNLEAGDALAAKVSDPIARAAIEWVALRNVPQKIGLDRIQAFETNHPNWPAEAWLRRQNEVRLIRISDPKAIEGYFASRAPITSYGKYTLARALKADGRASDAAKVAKELLRDGDLSGGLEGKLKTDFGGDLTKADYKFRADRLIYKEQIGAGLHFAAEAGADVVALEKARAAVIAEAPSDKAIAAVPDSLRNDPGLILAGVQRLRRTDKLVEAANLMQTAPRDPLALVDGDAWWTERRMLARKLLDDGKVNSAYVIVATPAAVSSEAKVEAQFHAGWIALRFMNDPPRAAYHFAKAAKLAESPSSIARIAYWQARTLENSVDPDAAIKATAFYRQAAEYGSTYYGQLAHDALGLEDDPVHKPVDIAVGADRNEGIRVIELLYAAGEKDSAYALAYEAADSMTDEKQTAALSAVISAQHDAHLALTIGKVLCQRGIAADELAFPTIGIPSYEALQNSAPTPVVYSIARQESAFMPAVVSKAGAKGLMQMIDSTARITATKAGIPFDGARMLTDASFNAKLGAAHLGTLLAEQGGSYILTFAAYNAGGGRVKQWIDAYGDPRKPGVDPIDWVERIPFTETRNYVQRVMANVVMYKAIFADQAKAQARASRPDREAKL